MSLVSQMAFQNPWWADPSAIEKDEKVATATTSKPTIIPRLPESSSLIMGPRQSGKTTAMKLAIRELLRSGADPASVLYFSCDSLRDKDDLIRLMDEYRRFHAGSSYVFLDEITFVRDWNVGLLHLFNAGYLRDSRVYVTGSSSVSLYKEALPGRPIKKVVLYPLNFRVFFEAFYRRLEVPSLDVGNVKRIAEVAVKLIPYLNELNSALSRYLITGGFLASAYKEGDPLPSVYETYKDAMLSDLAKLGREERYFKEIMRAVIEKYASRVSENSIAKETSAGSHNTVASYLDLSEKLFLTRIVYRVEWGTGYKPLFRSNKKVYFTDPLLYRVMKLYALGDGRLADEELAKLLEGVIGEHLMRRYRAGYAIAKSGKEVDFALGDVAVEVKGRSASLRDLNWEKGYVLSHDEFDVTENKAMVPASIFLYLISEDRLFYDF
ncbi:MAG: ATP-binding protein [Thermoprotei archaeon]